jgi:hypothetical protein
MLIRILRFVLRLFGLDVVRVASESASESAQVRGGSASGSFESLRGHYEPPAYRSSVVGFDDTLKVVDVVEFNATVEPQAVAFLCSYISERGPQRLSVVCAEIAFRFDVSIETAKRWVRKHSAESAEFVVSRGVVDLRRVE